MLEWPLSFRAELLGVWGLRPQAGGAGGQGPLASHSPNEGLPRKSEEGFGRVVGAAEGFGYGGEGDFAFGYV